MIRIGLTAQEKQSEINNYLAQHDINKIFIFYPDKFPVNINVNTSIEHIRYTDIIEYKFFYRLLEVIDNKTLLVYNECLRTQNRSDLTYNCAHHYSNQTSHKIVFEKLPFIEQNSDFMILLDLLSKGKYKGKSFDYRFLNDEDVKVKPCDITLQTIDIELTEEDIKCYESKRDRLFINLGNADPDTIPRQLHIFAGGFKKKILEMSIKYVTRNERFKLPNITTYRNITDVGYYVIIDFPHRRIDFNDFLKITDMNDICFVSSGLKVDLYYINELKKWIERLNNFYAQASIYK